MSMGRMDPEGMLYDALCRLCWSQDLWNRDDFWQPLHPHARRLLELAWAEGLFPDVYAGLKRSGGDVGAFDERYSQYEQGRAKLLATLPYIRDEALIVKGFGIEAFYPPGRRRYSSDCDVVVATIADFFNAVKKLFDRGYEMNQCAMGYRDPTSGEVWGGARLSPIPELPESLGQIELQIGMYPMTHGTQLPFAAFTKSTEIVSVGNANLRVPGAMGQLLIMLAEFQGRDRLKIRDVYDWTLISARVSVAEMAKVIDTAYAFGIENGLWLLRNALRAIGPSVRLGKMDAFLYDRRVRSARFRRGRLAHTWKHLRFVTQTRFPIFRTVIQAFRGTTLRWNETNRYMPLLRAMDFKGMAKHFFEIGFLVYLFRLDSHSAPWRWFQIKGHALLGTDVGTFVATTNGVLTDSDLGMLWADLATLNPPGPGINNITTAKEEAS